LSSSSLSSQRFSFQIKEKNTLLKVGFGTVGEYLWLLRGIAQLVNGHNSLLYCAAAVSDFYIRPSEMVCLPLSSVCPSPTQKKTS
jgi:hypothetical protein